MPSLLATLPLLLAADAVSPYHLSTAGGAIMACSIGSVLTLVGFCLYRVLTLTPPESEELKGPLAIDTGDTQDAD